MHGGWCYSTMLQPWSSGSLWNWETDLNLNIPITDGSTTNVHTKQARGIIRRKDQLVCVGTERKIWETKSPLTIVLWSDAPITDFWFWSLIHLAPHIKGGSRTHQGLLHTRTRKPRLLTTDPKRVLTGIRRPSPPPATTRLCRRRSCYMTTPTSRCPCRPPLLVTFTLSAMGYSLMASAFSG